MLEHNLRFRGTYYIFFFIINTHLDKTKKTPDRHPPPLFYFIFDSKYHMYPFDYTL